MVDLLVDHLTTLAAEPTTRGATRAEMERLFRESVPEEPADPAEVLERVRRDVFGNVMYLNHPRFFGWVPGPTNFVSIMAEAIASTYNPFMGSWLVSAGPAEVELVTIDWLREMLGMPADAGGLFTSGGSAANLTALATARHTALADDASTAVVYSSKETHSSVERALRVLGFAREQLRQLPTDDGFRLVAADLEQAIRRDRAAGRRPFCVVANAGTTNTGAVDPLPELAELWRTQGLWY
ncbi:MAG: aminotransferase class V-fold PLP-dependent enzyme, partial [Actinobacteria bacterium]|nr:aminotransferase class V-fold PLP-dependent enzyme [Actinomycetota bacterium]